MPATRPVSETVAISLLDELQETGSWAGSVVTVNCRVEPFSTSGFSWSILALLTTIEGVLLELELLDSPPC